MSERHIVECDWCGKQANMVFDYIVSSRSAFPAGWWRYRGDSYSPAPALTHYDKVACPACAAYIKLVKECGFNE